MRREAQAGNDKVLSYGDNLLRRGDVELLQGPHWLNDQIITFYFDYLRLERFAKEHDDVLFVGGAMTFLLNQPAGTGALSDIVAPLELASRKLVLFAVNNNPDCSMAEGGSHWSLLVYSQTHDRFHHYDSSPGSNNLLVARQLSVAVRPFLGHSSQDSKVHAAFTPTQTNAYDCGMYVLACAELIVEQWTQNCGDEATESAVRRQLMPHFITDKRLQLLSLIEAKADELRH
ncbi:hypothetical protein ABBQ38_009940 [Trebouxia sp. C0009 RCD-2024]